VQVSRIVVGRQAIQDRNRKVVAYELLFRSAADTAGTVTGDQMTADVVFGALNIGLNHVVHGRKIFCNADRGVLVGDLPINLPPEQTVIEVLETVAPDEDVVAGCRQLVSAGFDLALDDFVWFEGAEVLLDLAKIVKIDILATRGDELSELIERCRPFGVKLLAEKVESEAEYERCLDDGFELFQGYLLERPVVVSGRTIEAGRASRIKMAAALLGDDLDFDEINEMLRADPGLAYQIIQLASLGRPGETRRNVNTTRDALVLMGTRRIQNWMALILARPDQPTVEDGFAKTLMRARACEILAAKISEAQASIGFAAGLLSSLDLLFGIPPDELRQSLPIGDELAEAAFGDESQLARIVRAAVDYQLGTGVEHASGPTEQELDQAFANAFVWTMEASNSLGV
jgi:EAL and modified HD-GYP domain-containing signal transduction protein